MAFPVTGELADLSVSTTGTDLHYLLETALRDTAATAAWEGGGLNSTGMSATGVAMNSYTAGLQSGTINFTGIYPKASPRLGNSGQLSFASGYTEFVQSWELNIDFGEQEITSLTGGVQNWRTWMPGGVGTWGGSYVARAVNTPVYTRNTVAGGQGAAATFKLSEDGTDDPSLAGNIIITGVSHPITDLAARQELTYTFSGCGPLTQKAGDTLPGLLYAGTTPTEITRPQWDTSGTDGVPDITCVLKYYTSRTFTGPAFWRSLQIQCAPDGLITVSGVLRMAGEWTGA